MTGLPLPGSLRTALRECLRVLGDPDDIRSTRLLSGGMINNAANVQTAHAQYLVKWNDSQPGKGLLAGEPQPALWPGLFEAEAAGLRLLASTQTVRVPQVLAVGPSREQTYGAPPFILLEWLEGAPESPSAMENLGAQVAELHRVGTAPNFGLDGDNYLGSVLQVNRWYSDWVTFFIECRLRPQIALARKLGRLPALRERRLEHLIERLPALLAGVTHRPSLIHGDLWGGNIIPVPSGLALIDPAVSYSDREAEIAYTELFGGFSAHFYSGYNSAWPLDPGYVERRDIYNLYHLVNHLNHFGEPYGQHVDSVLKGY